jgi:hypothetical protein
MKFIKGIYVLITTVLSVTFILQSIDINHHYSNGETVLISLIITIGLGCVISQIYEDIKEEFIK